MEEKRTCLHHAVTLSGTTNPEMLGTTGLSSATCKQASALGAMAVSVGEWQKVPFSVGECGELISTVGIVEKIFDLRKNGGNGAVKNGYFVSVFSHFSPILLPCLSHFPQPHPATTLHNPRHADA